MQVNLFNGQLTFCPLEKCNEVREDSDGSNMRGLETVGTKVSSFIDPAMITYEM